MTHDQVRTGLLVIAFATAACTEDPTEPGRRTVDAASDSARDGSVAAGDARVETAIDTAHDARVETAIDAAHDARADAEDRDGGDTQGDAAAECCPPDPTPSCCMHYGGRKGRGGTCPQTCDGMPVPSDPAWRLVTGESGCPRWSSVGAGNICCGTPPLRDGGPIYSCYGDNGEPPRLIDTSARDGG